MNQLIVGLKREYWEYKRQLVITPLIVTGLFFLVAMVATWTHHGLESELAESKGAKVELSLGADVIDEEQNGKNEAFWFSGVYLAVAWLIAIFYALSSLYNDRRDKSILYWKTLPVSELQTVFIKLLFAILAFSAIAVVVSWLSVIVLISYAHLVFSPEVLANDVAGMSFTKLVFWPIAVMVVALLWCAPFFAMLLFVSAQAKKSPILMLVISLVVIRVLERILFGSDHVFGFIWSHSPISLVSNFSEMYSIGELLNTYLIASFPSLILGLTIAGLLICLAAWRRNRYFEI